MQRNGCWAERDGRRIYFFEAGDGKPVMLLNQSLLTGRGWLPVVQSLVDEGYRVIVPDLAGHGASDAPDRIFGVPDLIADVWAVYDALSLRTAALVGVSFGGLISLGAAATNPERISRLAISGTGASTKLSAFVQFAKWWSTDLQAPGGPLRSLDLIWNRNVSEQFRLSEEGSRTYQAWHADFARADGAGLAHVVEGTSGYEVPNLSHWTKPTLLILADNDPVSPLLAHLEAVFDRCSLSDWQVLITSRM